MSSSTGRFVHRHRVRFGDCDPAGIVYFPRFFALLHETMEAWFDQALGLRYAELVEGRRLGLPAVHSEADFVAPAGLGEELHCELALERVGRTSIGLRYVVRGAAVEDVRVRAATVCALMDLDPASTSHRRAVAIPEDLRARFSTFAGGSIVGSG